MGQTSKNGQNWNEFQWEREIRRDERRISCYFRELALCLDLPGEDNIIFDNLMSQPGLVPAGADPDHWRIWDSMEENGDGEEDGDTRKRRPGDELVEQTDKLACEWNVIFASRLQERYRKAGLGTACAFGKLITRLADFTDTDADDGFAGLKISLGKRALSDINELAGRLAEMGRLQKDILPEAIVLTEMLQLIRERLLDILQKIRG